MHMNKKIEYQKARTSVKMDNVFQFKRRRINADGLQNSE
jgi:hypothetical protein